MEERTSPEIATLAARGLSNPESLSAQEVRRLAASALTQAADQEPLPSAIPDDP